MKEVPVSFRITLEKPVRDIFYAVQIGSGNNYDLEQKQFSGSADLHFVISIPATQRKDGSWVLKGPLVQGPPLQRFFYINLGSYAGQEQPLYSGRLKIPLPDLTEEVIDKIQKGAILKTTVPGTTSKDGRPTMATVKPFAGWDLSKNNN